MPKFSETKILPYEAKKIHDLVMDIEKYPQFLPWCKQIRIVETKSDCEIIADVLVSFKNFLEKYRSQIKFGKDDLDVYFVETRAIDGPFKNLFSTWKIKIIDKNSCEVEFFIDFQFNSFLLEKMIGVIFEKAALRMIKSFEDRAEQLFSQD